MMRGTNVAFFVPHRGCPHRCVFCDQHGISGAGAAPTGEEVATTLAAAAENLGERVQSSEIAFFGGSFTAIPREEMVRLLSAAAPFLGRDGFAGIRVSTRPDAVGPEVLDLLAEHGVTAIELGAQSMDNRVLAAGGRGHTAADTVRAAAAIRERGFSLCVQMMTGLPGDSGETAWETAGALLDLRPDAVRIYPALVLEGTGLAELWRSGRYRPQTLEEAADLCGRLLERFHRSGVPVIRLGLHDSPSLRESLLAGPYHPAFRELCEGAVLLRKALGLLESVPPGPVELRVARGSASKMAGQRRANLLELERRGYPAKIYEDAAVPYLELRTNIGHPASC